MGSSSSFFIAKNNILENNKAKSRVVYHKRYHISEILQRKQINVDIFDETFEEFLLRTKIDTADQASAFLFIHLHAIWAYHYIYSIPYPKTDLKKNKGIARLCHGIQHVSRVSTYISIFANLYRRYGDEEALNLRRVDLWLLQIAALFHDSAREDEEEDLWDHESGLLLYCYFVQVMRCKSSYAKYIVEAAVNKDADDFFLELTENEDGSFSWVKAAARKKSIFQKLIHDADCLDIIRARDHFDATYLDFYQDIACHHPEALDDLARIIMEATSLIESHGDGRLLMDITTKKTFEHIIGSIKLIDSLSNHPTLFKLYADGKFLPKEELARPLFDKPVYEGNKPLTPHNMQAALLAGKVFARAIATPSARRRKIYPQQKTETLAEMEIRKMTRRKGVATWSQKSNNCNKHGNPDRSVSLIGWGGATYSSTGFLIVDPELENISIISSVDCHTGRDKKVDLHNLKKCTDNQARLLNELLVTLKLGGRSTRTGKQDYIMRHTEMIMQLTDVDAIYYTNDHNLHNQFSTDSSYPIHTYAPLLQALYLQQVFEKITGDKLPIYQYERFFNRLTHNPIPIETAVELWKKTCIDYIRNKYLNEKIINVWIEFCHHALVNHCMENIDDMIEAIAISIEQIKTESIYGKKSNPFQADNAPADVELSIESRDKINAAIKDKLSIIYAQIKTLINKKKIRLDYLSFIPCISKNIYKYDAKSLRATWIIILN